MRQFEDIPGELQFSEALLDWMREALRQSQKEKAEFHRRAIEKLNAQYAKLQNRIDQIYLDKLDGEVEEAFYRRNVSAWREEQAQIRARIERHEKADQNYIEQGIRLVGPRAERARVLPGPQPGGAGGPSGLHSARLDTRPGPGGSGLQAAVRHHPQDCPRSAAHQRGHKKTGISAPRQCLSNPAPPAGLEPATGSLTRPSIPLVEDALCFLKVKGPNRSRARSRSRSLCAVVEQREVVESTSDLAARLYYRFSMGMMVGDKYLCAVVKIKDKESFVLTAHLTDRMKRGVRQETWILQRDAERSGHGKGR